MATGMARFFKVTGVSNPFKLNSVPALHPESRKKNQKLSLGDYLASIVSV